MQQKKTLEDYRNMVKILKLKVIKQNTNIDELNSKIKLQQDLIINIKKNKQQQSLSKQFFQGIDLSKQIELAKHLSDLQKFQNKSQLINIYSRTAQLLGITAQSIFRIVDKNYQMNIRVQDFRKLIENFKVHFNKSQVSTLIYMFDEKCSGKISLEQYNNCLAAYNANFEDMSSFYRDKCLQKYAKLVKPKQFETMENTLNKDMNMSNVVNYIGQNYNEISEKQAVAIFNQIDLDGSGKITKKSFKYAIKSILNKSIVQIKNIPKPPSPKKNIQFAQYKPIQNIRIEESKPFSQIPTNPIAYSKPSTQKNNNQMVQNIQASPIKANQITQTFNKNKLQQQDQNNQSKILYRSICDIMKVRNKQRKNTDGGGQDKSINSDQLGDILLQNLKNKTEFAFSLRRKVQEKNILEKCFNSGLLLGEVFNNVLKGVKSSRINAYKNPITLKKFIEAVTKTKRTITKDLGTLLFSTIDFEQKGVVTWQTILYNYLQYKQSKQSYEIALRLLCAIMMKHNICPQEILEFYFSTIETRIKIQNFIQMHRNYINFQAELLIPIFNFILGISLQGQLSKNQNISVIQLDSKDYITKCREVFPFFDQYQIHDVDTEDIYFKIARKFDLRNQENELFKVSNSISQNSKDYQINKQQQKLF